MLLLTAFFLGIMIAIAAGGLGSAAHDFMHFALFLESALDPYFFLYFLGSVSYSKVFWATAGFR